MEHKEYVKELREITEILYNKFCSKDNLEVDTAVARTLYELEDDLDDELAKYIIYNELYRLTKNKDSKSKEQLSEVIEKMSPTIDSKYSNFIEIANETVR